MSDQNHPASLSRQAYEIIRQKIVSLALPPGAVIDEARLRNELGLGRTPIRESLKRLELERLVTIVPRRGMFVTEIGITDLQRLYEVRLQLEPLAAQLAARRGTNRHWQEMEAVLAKLETSREPISNETYIHIDETCHQIMYAATDNEFLQSTLHTLYALSLRLWYFSLSDSNHGEKAIVEHKHIVEHQHILDALRAGEGRRAADLMRAHIQTFQDEIQSVMLGSAFASS